MRFSQRTVLCAAMMLSGCFVSEPGQAASAPPQSIAVYLRHSSMDRTSFEQFRLVQQVLYSECGDMLGGRPVVKETLVSNVPAEQLEIILDEASQLAELAKMEGVTFEAPGDMSGFFNRGEYRANLDSPNESVTVRASLTSIVNADAPREVHARRLAAQLHESTGHSLCGRKSFFGIEN